MVGADFLVPVSVTSGAALTVLTVSVYDDRMGGAGRRSTHSQGICEGICERVAGGVMRHKQALLTRLMQRTPQIRVA